MASRSSSIRSLREHSQRRFTDTHTRTSTASCSSIGALLGEEIVYREPGDLIFKPRGQRHTFWNDGTKPAQILELISPAGFERCVEEMVDLLEQGGQPDPSALAAIAARYGLEVDRDSIPRLKKEHGLHFGPPAP